MRNAWISLVLIFLAFAVVGCDVTTEPPVTTITTASTITSSPTPTPTTPTFTPTPTSTPPPTATPFLIVVKTDIRYRGGAGIYKGPRSLDDFYKGRVPRGEAAEALGRVEYNRDLGVGTPQPIKTRWVYLKYGELSGFSALELFEWTRTDADFLALPIIDIDWSTGLPIPTATPSSTPTLKPTSSPAAYPTFTAVPIEPVDSEDTAQLFTRKDRKAVIRRYKAGCTGILESFENGDEVTVFGRKQFEEAMYVGKVGNQQTYIYAFVPLTCLDWSGDIKNWAVVVFPTPMPPTPTPTPLPARTTRR